MGWLTVPLDQRPNNHPLPPRLSPPPHLRSHPAARRLLRDCAPAHSLPPQHARRHVDGLRPRWRHVHLRLLPTALLPSNPAGHPLALRPRPPPLPPGRHPVLHPHRPRRHRLRPLRPRHAPLLRPHVRGHRLPHHPNPLNPPREKDTITSPPRRRRRPWHPAAARLRPDRPRPTRHPDRHVSGDADAEPRRRPLSRPR